MNTIFTILVVVRDATETPVSIGMNSSACLIIGAVIGFLLLGYMVFVLLKPEKF
jgi:K+-transporting ATPase KdpF subunit